MSNIKKVMIIDDSEIIGRRLVQLLSLPSLKVFPVAKSFSQALEIFPKIKPDIIVLDFNIPGGNGIELLKKLKKIRPTVKAIMLTNSTAAVYKRKFKESGGDIFLDKTNDFINITDAVFSLTGSLE